MEKPTMIVDGNDFFTLEEFLLKIRDVLAPRANDRWLHNLDALNDELYRGDEKPEGGFILLWKNSAVSKKRLGYAETVRQLQKKAETCHPTNRDQVIEEIETAMQSRGKTVFDWIVEIIRVHEDVEFRLE